VRLREAGKPAKVALTAYLRKLLTTLNAIAGEGQYWNGDAAPAQLLALARSPNGDVDFLIS
jgi:hypothetical protein